MADVDPNNPRKEYTGVWIPAEVMECDDLSPIDKLVYGEVASFKECYASNAWLAKRIQRSEMTARRSVNKLIKLGFIKQGKNNGRFRTVMVFKNDHPVQKRTVRVFKNEQSACSKMNTIDKSIDKSIDIVSKDTIGEIATKGTDSSLQVVERTQRSLDIDKAFEIWEEVMGMPIVGNKGDERFAINTLLSRKGMDLDKLRTMLLLAREADTDRYKRFSITCFRDLQRNSNALLAWARERQAQQHKAASVAEV